MKVAIYARYSTDMQNPASIEDQIRTCEENITAVGGTKDHRSEELGESAGVKVALCESRGQQAPDQKAPAHRAHQMRLLRREHDDRAQGSLLLCSTAGERNL